MDGLGGTGEFETLDLETPIVCLEFGIGGLGAVEPLFEVLPLFLRRDHGQDVAKTVDLAGVLNQLQSQVLGLFSVPHSV
jgi:hypothetical protein